MDWALLYILCSVTACQLRIQQPK